MSLYNFQKTSEKYHENVHKSSIKPIHAIEQTSGVPTSKSHRSHVSVLEVSYRLISMIIQETNYLFYFLSNQSGELMTEWKSTGIDIQCQQCPAGTTKCVPLLLALSLITALWKKIILL